MPDSEDEEIIIIYWWWRRRRRLQRLRERGRARPAQWVSDFLLFRNLKGAYINMVQEIQQNDLSRFINFHRMTPENFNRLLEKVEPAIKKQDVVRESLSPGLRLSLTLRYLASGDSMVSLHFLYRVSKSSITRIIPETCNAIWDALSPEVLKLPASPREWARIAEDFETLWDFPNCLGAIDGKHIVVQCFNNTGSQFYNYKNSFSIVLMAICDAHYRFTFVSIGAAGRESDSMVFENSSVGSLILNGTLAVPPPRILPGSNIVVPHVFLGDNAFPLKQNLMHPYPGQNIHASKVIFNYRLSRPRRMIENTFGVLANKFRIFRKPIIASPPTVESVVKASVVLHNFLRTDELNVAPRMRTYMQPGLVDTEDMDGNIELGSWRAEAHLYNGMQDVAATRSRNPSVLAAEVRDKYREYFMTHGQVPFQWNKLPSQERRFYSQ